MANAICSGTGSSFEGHEWKVHHDKIYWLLYHSILHLGKSGVYTYWQDSQINSIREGLSFLWFDRLLVGYPSQAEVMMYLENGTSLRIVEIMYYWDFRSNSQINAF